jgi:hypothetical protein
MRTLGSFLIAAALALGGLMALPAAAHAQVQGDECDDDKDCGCGSRCIHGDCFQCQPEPDGSTACNPDLCSDGDDDSSTGSAAAQPKGDDDDSSSGDSSSDDSSNDDSSNDDSSNDDSSNDDSSNDDSSNDDSSNDDDDSSDDASK